MVPHFLKRKAPEEVKIKPIFQPLAPCLIDNLEVPECSAFKWKGRNAEKEKEKEFPQPALTWSTAEKDRFLKKRKF